MEGHARGKLNEGCEKMFLKFALLNFCSPSRAFKAFVKSFFYYKSCDRKYV